MKVPGEEDEKSLDVPKTLSQVIVANLAKGHTNLEITRHGTGLGTRYTVIVA